MNLNPVFTAIIVRLTLGERLGLVQLIGVLSVIGDVTLASSADRKGTDGGRAVSTQSR